MSVECGIPDWSSHVMSFWPTVSTTSVSPSQWPIESPSHVNSTLGSCGRPSMKILRQTCAPPSYTITTSCGVCTIVHGYGVVFVRGTPGGRQRASGSSLLRFSLRFLYTASAGGSIGTSTPEPTMSTFWRIAFGCQLPDRSGWPSAVRGVGPAGGQSSPPPRPWAAAAFEISSIAAAAAIENVQHLANNFIEDSSTQKYTCTFAPHAS